jgi:metallo-beta-lactamase family protein
MKMRFMGAAKTVTGSCCIVEGEGFRFAVDCGMHQGNSDIEKRNIEILAYEPHRIDFVLLTHAHIDHSGLLPRLIHNGFKGPIYCTPPTADLTVLMLEDSAHIQEVEAVWREKKHARVGDSIKDIAPLYTIKDAQKVSEYLKTVDYGKSFRPRPNVEVIYRDPGHILGSAFIELTITENNLPTRIVFSGDVGRPGALLMHHSATPSPADYLVIESTYGDRNHKGEDDSLNELLAAINYAYGHREKVIIPAFAVGRTQEILYSLFLLHKEGKLPRDIPIYVDSPLAIRVTELFRKYKEYLEFGENADVYAANGEIKLPNLHFTLTAGESQILNSQAGTGIVIAASGMCNAGRIRHHLRHNAWKPGASIVFVGYQGVGTPGRFIVDGSKSVRLFGEDVAVNARIFTIGGFSGHAGQQQLLDWAAPIVEGNPNLHAIIVHGEAKAQETFKELMNKKFGIDSVIPDYLEEIELAAGCEPVLSAIPEAGAVPAINWQYLRKDTCDKMDELRSRLEAAPSLPWDMQVALRDRVLELNKELLSALTRSG